jgi:hypothetical protein
MSHGQTGSLLERLASRLSVRTRIALIALAPICGFFIVGAAYAVCGSVSCEPRFQERARRDAGER